MIPLVFICWNISFLALVNYWSGEWSSLVACTQAQLLMIHTIQWGALNSGRGCTGLTLIQLGLGATFKVSSGKSSCLEPVIRGNIHDVNSRLVMAEQYRWVRVINWFTQKHFTFGWKEVKERGKNSCKLRGHGVHTLESSFPPSSVYWTFSRLNTVVRQSKASVADSFLLHGTPFNTKCRERFGLQNWILTVTFFYNNGCSWQQNFNRRKLFQTQI